MKAFAEHGRAGDHILMGLFFFALLGCAAFGLGSWAQRGLSGAAQVRKKKRGERRDE